MKIYFICKYCGNKWDRTYYYEVDVDEICCTICKDKNIIIKRESEKMDYYIKEIKKK